MTAIHSPQARNKVQSAIIPLETIFTEWYHPGMKGDLSERDRLRAKIEGLENDLRREKERVAFLEAERERLRHLIFPPLSDAALSDLLNGVREQELLGPETAGRELEALLDDRQRDAV